MSKKVKKGTDRNEETVISFNYSPADTKRLCF